MFETVTVDEALSKGRKMVIYPITAIILGAFGFGTYLFVQFNMSSMPMYIGVALGVALGWLYWSFVITKWRIWAFDNVRNVHELKKKAIRAGLIWPDNSFFERSEIRTSSEKEKWLSLQKKFNQPDVFLDDYSIPVQTEIHYSKKKGIIDLVWIIPIFGFGVYYLISNGITSLIGYLILAMPLLYLYLDYKIISNRKSQIILNNEGMGTVNVPLYKWTEIHDEKTLTEFAGGKYSRSYLVYIYPNGNEKLQIDNFDIQPKELEHLMDIYRGRSEQKTNSHKLS